jgi:hypothetical protein
VTKLLYDELQTTLSQTFTLNHGKRYHIHAFKPVVYIHNAPSGTFTFKIKDGATELYTVNFTSADCKTEISTSNNYLFLNKKFIPSAPISMDGGKSYTLELSSSGYSFAESSHIGWIKQHDSDFHDYDGTPTTDCQNPKTVFFFEERTE